MAKVAAYILDGNGKAREIVPRLAHGAEILGDEVEVFSDAAFTDAHAEKFDTAILWGYVKSCQNIMAKFKAAGKAAVYLDMAYWARTDHYKVAVNSRHPTEYFQKFQHDDVRRKRFGVEPRAWYMPEGSASILLAGMSEKAAWVEGLEPMGTWEVASVLKLRQHTDRPILYRPKRPTAPPIPGTTFCNPSTTPLDDVLPYCYAVVTHHSNVGVDGLVAGVPVFTEQGVATTLGLQDLALINYPRYPDSREQFLNDVAYCQWSTKELKNGLCWQHLKAEGLIA